MPISTSSSEDSDLRPFQYANIFSRFFYHWFSPLLSKCRQQGTLHLHDLYDLPDYLQSKTLTDQLEENWFAELKNSPKNPSLIRATIRTLGWKPFLFGLIETMNGFIHVVRPLLLIFLMYFFAPCSTMPIWKAWLYAIATVAAAFCSAVIFHRFFYQIEQHALQLRVAHMGLIFRKILRLSSQSLNTIGSGEIINLISNDARRVGIAFEFFNYLWIVPITMILVIYVFWYFVRYIAFIAIGFTLFLLGIQPIIGRFYVCLRTKVVEITDERVKLMSEIIKSMRIVKMYCWESAFVQKICHLRKKEIVQYSLLQLCDTFQVMLTTNYIPVNFLLMYGAMWLFNLKVTTEFFAVAACMLAFMRVSIVQFFSYAIHDFALYISARKRIENFLLLDESERDNRLLSTSCPQLHSTDDDRLKKRSTQVICYLKKAQWNQNETFALKNIFFDAHPGDLICVIGPVGSGKSSLLQTLAGEISLFDGKVRLRGSFCYVPQEAWIFSSTIKNNILFGKSYDEKLFERVIRVTALDTDFNELSQGMNTLVGDHGVMLSGGQKARVNLARALYCNADIYLLDDPLSAVDVKVSRHLFEKAIKGYLQDKICILVTHQIQFLEQATKIILLEQGEMTQMGTYTELLTSSSSFAQLIEDIHQHEKEKEENEQKQNLQRQQSFIINGSKQSLMKISRENLNHDHNGDDEISTFLDDVDIKQEGTVGWRVYRSYIRAGLGSLLAFALLLLLFTIQQTTIIYSRWWLATWSDDENYRHEIFPNCTSSNEQMKIDRIRLMNSTEWNNYRNHRLVIYCLLVIVLLFFTLIRTFAAKMMCLNAGRVLHNRMFQRIIRCPIHVFDTNPVGRILNRFTSDISIMDENLAADVPDFLECLFEVLGTVILVGILNPWAFIPAIIGVCVMFIIRYRFAQCSRDLKRLEGVTRSPIYSHLNSTIHGLQVIRSYHVEDLSSQEFLRFIDENSRVHFMIMTKDRWAAMRFDVVCSLFLAMVTFLALFVRIHQQSFSAADIALTLSYSLGLMGLFQWTIRQNVQVETQMTAVERILEYCTLDQEPPAHSPHQSHLIKEWPSQGRIVFDHVSMSYTDDTDPSSLALDDISLVIESGEKIGIIGRTGAGKSSFIQILFRMGHLVQGTITIDDVNLVEIGLDDVRSRISIIPQNPVLFTGTMKNNLDPFHQYRDEEIWHALEKVQLKTLVNETMSNGLDSIVNENGSNLSVGQKQLVCLTRAILKKSKILVIDEATANVDNATDEMIQKAIREQFKHCTVLTVAHRLRTVIDNDRILVLNHGKLLEFDKPSVLLNDSNSHLSSFVEQAGASEAEYLRKSFQISDTSIRTVIG